MAVPYTASDDQSGVASVELWARYRPNEARPWGTWALASSANSSPISYAFAPGDGNYEFYTVAIDGAGNREDPPAQADVATRRDAVDDPPDFTITSLSAGVASCQGPSPCPAAIISCSGVCLSGAGTAADDRSIVTVSWQLWGVKANGQRQRLFSYKSATPVDGAFDSRVEGFSLADDRRDSNYVYYDVDVMVTAGGQSTTRTTRIQISRPMV